MMQDDAIKRVIAQVVREYLAQSSAPGTPPSGLQGIFPSEGADDGSAVCLHADGSFTAPVEASARHVHLSQKDLERLFGAGYRLRPKKYLSQPGQFLSEERVTVKGPKGQFANVAVLGPVRSATQVEVSLSDARVLGVGAGAVVANLVKWGFPAINGMAVAAVFFLCSEFLRRK